MELIPLQQATAGYRPLVRKLLWPMSILVLAMGAALVGAVLTGTDTGAVTGGVESLSASTGNLLSRLSTVLPLGYAFGAGMVSAANPCGFAMLPAYLGLYLGETDSPGQGGISTAWLRQALLWVVTSAGFIFLFSIVGWSAPVLNFLWIGLSLGVLARVGYRLIAGGSLYRKRLWRDLLNSLARLRRALLVASVVTVGFILLFGIVGLAIGAGAKPLIRFFPWIGLSLGMLLALAGAWLLAGGALYTALAEQMAARMGNAQRRGVRGYFAFGLGYGTASLSCTLPIFLTVVGSTITTGTVAASAVQFSLYGLGMGTVILALTLSIALFQSALVGVVRRAVPYVQPVSAVLLVLAGAYLVYYWLTLGGLLDTFR